jgi:hypothetical protein
VAGGRRKAVAPAAAGTGANRPGAHGTAHIEGQLQQGPAGGFLEGLGAGSFEGYKLGYTGGTNPDADKVAIGRAATQKGVVYAKSRCKKKIAVAQALNTNRGSNLYKAGGTFRQQFDQFFPPTAKYRQLHDAFVTPSCICGLFTAHAFATCYAAC